MKTAPLLLSLLCSASASAAEPRRDVLGEWWTPGAWLWDDKPQGIADTSPLIGKPVIEQMRLAEPGRWAGGRLYNPEDGRDYKGSLQLRSESTLVVSGCVLFVCQTQVWRRVDPARCPPMAPP
jgi:uncharacterized protein (DUF2147 family)